MCGGRRIMVMHKIKNIKQKTPTLINDDGSWNIQCKTKCNHMEASESWGLTTCKRCLNEKEQVETRIKDLQERISMNNYDIEHGEDPDSKRISRGDNKFCKPRLKELLNEVRQ